MVLHKFGDKLYNGVAGALRSHLAGVAARIEAAQGLPFLKELKSCWDDHNKSTQMIRDILMYMDRTYVTQQHKAPVFQLGLDLWREQVVRQPQIHQRLLAILGDMVSRERAGEIVDRALLRATTQMLMDLGKPTYEEDFERHFLATAADFYAKEAQEVIASSNAPEYMLKAERRLAEEVERVKNYLDESTEPKITHVAEHELITVQMKALVEMEGSGLVPLLMDDKYEDLGRMYSLFKRVDDGLALLRSVMGSHIKEEGRALVNDPEKTKDPVEYVSVLLGMRDKYEASISRAFADDKSFRNTLNQSFEAFINQQQRSPEFISLFIDDRLRKGLKGASEGEVEATLDKVMALFRYLQEKDVFEKYYKQHLAKRLLSGRTVSDDAERNMLVKLKTECGYQFTSKLESMFTDIKTSRDTMGDFKARLAEQGEELPLDLSVQVLTTGSWPTQAASKCVLPAQLEGACETFRQFYLGAHSGRRLSWQTNMGTADLKANFNNGKAKHEITVSTYQMVVLLLFNEAEQLSYREIAEATEIPAQELKRSLQSLACAKGKNVLRKEPMSKEVEESDSFTFNDAFTSKLYKIKIGTVSAQKEGEVEKQETRHKVEEDRKPQIEAAIVRIMKSRKRLDHNAVVSEVTRQLASRFLPNPAVIKKRIESLIEREFLERDPNDRKVYVYLA
eukprot:GHRQ01003012.1.p1 GENE.GHRQ01003012.1~~GHRQ01003012.1.p1  ORF type:complete len:735 (+),score=416.28 GHRQ01003012.1:173-2206(+)